MLRSGQDMFHDCARHALQSTRIPRIASTTYADLYEVVITAEANDYPPPALVAADGFYHSNEIFKKVEHGWVYRSRAGNWMKVLGGFVDTKCAFHSRLLTKF